MTRDEIDRVVLAYRRQAVTGYAMKGLTPTQLKTLRAPNLMTPERVAVLSLCGGTILAEVSRGDFMDKPLGGLTLLHIGDEGRDDEEGRSGAFHSVTELMDRLAVVDAGG